MDENGGDEIWIRHLERCGSTQAETCEIMPEIKIRKTSCNVALGTIGSRCFNHQHIKMETKINITRAHIFSRLTFPAGRSHLFNEAEEKTFVSAVMNRWRRTTQATYKHAADANIPMLSGVEVIHQYHLVAPLNMAELIRLNLFVRLVSGANTIIKALVFAARDSQKSWLKVVQTDFDWLLYADRMANLNLFAGITDLRSWVPYIKANVIGTKENLETVCVAKEANRDV